MDFDIRRTGRQCCVTQRELRPGDILYSEVIDQDGQLARRDYCQEAWKGPSDGSLGFWKSQIPRRDSQRVYWAPRDVLLAYFDKLLGRPEKKATAYVMAILLIRKRVVQLVDTHDGAAGQELEVAVGKENTRRVPVMSPSGAEIAAVQEELAEHLFMDQPPEDAA